MKKDTSHWAKDIFKMHNRASGLKDEYQMLGRNWTSGRMRTEIALEHLLMSREHFLYALCLVSVAFVVVLTVKPAGLQHHTFWCLRCSSTCTTVLSSSSLAEAGVLNFSNTKLCCEVTFVME